MDSGAQTTYQDEEPLSDSELANYLWTLESALNLIRTKRGVLDDEEKQICALRKEVRAEMGERELVKEIMGEQDE